jgi:antitoxin FitA
MATTSITIRDVRKETRDELAARAAASGRSLQQYLKGELEALAATTDMATFFARVTARKDTTGSQLSAEEILAFRDADRR